MKKILLSMAVMLITVFYVNAQSFTLEWNGEVCGDTITLTPESPEATDIAFEAIFNNLTDVGVNIKVARNEIIMMDSTDSDFCWAGQCYPSWVDTSGNFQYVPAGGSSAEADFVAHYHIHNAVGVSLIEYTFYNNDNPDENVKIVVKFDTDPTTINENILKNIWLSDVYPNPATNFVTIDYRLPQEVLSANVKVVNILGSIVKEQNVDIRNNNMRMDITDINSGIYFYSLFVNGEVYSTKKLIVR